MRTYMLEQFAVRHLVFWLGPEEVAVEEERPLANAFNILMQASKEVNVVFNLLCLFCFHKAFYEMIKIKIKIK